MYLWNSVKNLVEEISTGDYCEIAKKIVGLFPIDDLKEMIQTSQFFKQQFSNEYLTSWAKMFVFGKMILLI